MEQDEVRLVLERINEAWLTYAADKIPAILNGCFDDRMVIKGPGFQTLSNGKQACIESYLDFLKESSVSACTLSTPDIDVSGDTAVATYVWQITYHRNGEEHTESGRDIFVFGKSTGRWLALWRAVLMG